MQKAQNIISPQLPNVRPLQANGQTRAPMREAHDVSDADYASWKASLADQNPTAENIPYDSVPENSTPPNLLAGLGGAGKLETTSQLDAAMNSIPQTFSQATATSQQSGLEPSADARQTPATSTPAPTVVNSTTNPLVAPQPNQTSAVQTEAAKPKQTITVTNQVAALTTDASLPDVSAPEAQPTSNSSVKPDPMAAIAVAASLNPQPQNPITLPQSAISTTPAIGTKPQGEHNPPRRSLTPDSELPGSTQQPAAAKTQTVSPTTVSAVNATSNSGAEQHNFGQLVQAHPASAADALVGADKSSTVRVDGMQLHALDRSVSHRVAIESQAPAATAQAFEQSPPIRELAVQISQHMDAGLNRFKMRLDPPELGRVDVRMEISPDGKLTAVIAVERPETLDLLQRDARALERSLMDAGIKTDSGSLNFSLRGGPNDGQQHANQNTANENGLAPWLNDIADLSDMLGTPIRFANRAINIRI